MVSGSPTAQFKGDLENIHRGAYASNRQFACEGTVRHSLSIISQATKELLFPEWFPDLPLHSSRVILKTYTGEPMPVIGNLHARVQYGTQAASVGGRSG